MYGLVTPSGDTLGGYSRESEGAGLESRTIAESARIAEETQRSRHVNNVWVGDHAIQNKNTSGDGRICGGTNEGAKA